MTNASPQPNAYLRTKVLTASPAELRLMLFDGAIKFAEQAREAIERQDHEAVYNGITRCQNIVMELINSLKPEHDPELCERLTALYTYIYTRLIGASSEHKVEGIAEALVLLRYERETWALLIERLGGSLSTGPASAVEQAVEARAGSLSVTG